MDRFKFWKKSAPPEADPGSPATISRFNVTPRQDVGDHGLPTDNEQANTVRRLRKRRESLVHEVERALEASQEHNRWRAEIALIEQALGEIDQDIESLPKSGGSPGDPVEPLEIQVASFTEEPTVQLELRIGSESFRFSEDLDWAERGFQLARSDLHLESGSVLALASDQRLQDHLLASLMVYATDVRDHLINGEPAPAATLADLAVPSVEFGGWLDWAGNSPFQAERNQLLIPLIAEKERLQRERDHLISEQARIAETLPFAERRLAEVDAELNRLQT